MWSGLRLDAHRRALAEYYVARALILERVDGPLSPAMRELERDHLDRIEQAICDAEGRIGRIERATPGGAAG
jgi:hypothetical protein